MKKLMLAAAGMAAAMGMAALPQGTPAVEVSPEAAPKPKRKTKRKRVAKATRVRNDYSRSKYIPGGENINCGERGISPKSYERVLAATKRRKGVKNPKMKES